MPLDHQPFICWVLGMRYDNTLKGRKKSFIMYGNVAVICALRRQKGVWIVLSVFIAMLNEIMLKYLGTLLACHVFIASVRTDWGVRGEGFEGWTFDSISIEKIEAICLFCFSKVALGNVVVWSTELSQIAWNQSPPHHW